MNFLNVHIGRKRLQKKKCKCVPDTNFEKVKEFHEIFRCTIGNFDCPGFTNESDRGTRLRLIKEEYDELAEAIEENHDNKEIAKELVDLLYVVYGTGIAMGIDLDEAFDLVHNSNMSKLDDDGEPIFNNYGKVMKSVNYRPPNLQEIANGSKKA